MANASEVDFSEELDCDQDSCDLECSGVRRPMNAFLIFCKRHRSIVREKYPHLENRSITKILGEWWANLEAEEKASYTDLAKQYKEAFMKANPDFKWYKMPNPPTRTLITRPTNQRPSKSDSDGMDERSGPSSVITPAKLADESQMGSLSSLLPVTTETLPVIPAPSTSMPTLSPLLMSRPPKKRYLENGALRADLEPKPTWPASSDTSNACSALLELAEMCTARDGSSPVKRVPPPPPPPPPPAPPTLPPPLSEPLPLTTRDEGFRPSFFHSNGQPPTSKPPQTAIPAYGMLPVLNVDVANQVIDKAFSQSPPRQQQPHSLPLGNSGLPILSKPMPIPPPPPPSAADEEQPLNLCKEKSKTICRSQQQIINHLVDKFLCGSNSGASFESSFGSWPIDSSSSVESNSNKNNANVAEGVLLSKAIESCIENAYKVDYKRNPSEQSLDLVTKKDTSSKKFDKFSSSEYRSNLLKSTVDNKPHTSSSSENCRLNSPTMPKKARVLRASQATSDSGNHVKEKPVMMFDDDESEGSSIYDGEPLSPSPRKSQRSCKGRRYQALMSEGILHPIKERRLSSGRKSSNGDEQSLQETELFKDLEVKSPNSKKNRKRNPSDSSESIKSDKDDISGKSSSVFNLEEHIAALPKCNMEAFTKKKKRQSMSDSLSSEDLMGDCDPTKDSRLSSAAMKRIRHSDNELGHSGHDRSGDDGPHSKHSKKDGPKRFKTGDFDLDEHIAALPKCDIEVLNRRCHQKRSHDSSGTMTDTEIDDCEGNISDLDRSPPQLSIDTSAIQYSPKVATSPEDNKHCHSKPSGSKKKAQRRAHTPDQQVDGSGKPTMYSGTSSLDALAEVASKVQKKLET